ncbi:uncharacterized protein BJ212DRAFT_1589678 [Suillus subaureus]|uniref:Uncharacterized protein n=1 Tax=Suillus subaureus TaxID=48587 RepID=A0A9P7E4S3_9AGAM|nr:uncharacterized protein BJ212DRAFT_1589678 [Suillus subaureus]KAG1810676.1 hypothetical protein BJ212DRAFT_1589678 [Suillus subaureus]
MGLGSGFFAVFSEIYHTITAMLSHATTVFPVVFTGLKSQCSESSSMVLLMVPGQYVLRRQSCTPIRLGLPRNLPSEIAHYYGHVVACYRSFSHYLKSQRSDSGRILVRRISSMISAITVLIGCVVQQGLTSMSYKPWQKKGLAYLRAAHLETLVLPRWQRKL